MELEFKQTELPHLKCIMQEVRYQEETGEAIVPDSYPDIGSIIDSFAVVILRGKDLREGSITVSGGIKGGVLYQPEDETGLKNLDFYLPFTLKMDHSKITENTKVICSVCVRSVDGRMINSRKAMLRAELGCHVTAYESTKLQLFELQKRSDDLQLLSQTYDIHLPLETSEKAFTIVDSMQLPSDLPSIDRICKHFCRLDLTDRKVVGNKGVFKGIAMSKLLYLSENDELCVYEQQIPFSQYCEFTSDQDEEVLSVVPVMTGYDLELTSQEPIRSAQVTIHILAQGIISGTHTVTLTEDAFSTSEDLTPAWQEFELTCQLDRRSAQHLVRCHTGGDISRCIDTDIYVGFPAFERTDRSICSKLPIKVHAIINSNGSISGAISKTELVQETAVSPQAQCAMQVDSIEIAETVLLTDGMETRCNIQTKAIFYTEQVMKSLCGGTLEEPDSSREKASSVILKRIPADTPLWDIAKKYRTKPHAIQVVNHLNEEILPEDCVLLIPIG